MMVVVIAVIELVDGRCNGHGDASDGCDQVYDCSDSAVACFIVAAEVHD